MHRTSFVIFAIFLNICLGLAVRPAWADKKEKAAEHFKLGLSHLDKNNYQEAAKEFESSLILYPNKNGFFNLAICYVQLHRYDEAINAINHLKKRFKDNLDEELKQDISNFEKKMESMIIRIIVSINVDGIVLEVDGKEIGQSPIDKPIILPRGKHKIVASQEGYLTEQRTITQETEPEVTLKFVMKKEPGHDETAAATPLESAESDTVPAQQQEKKGIKKIGWVPLAIAGGITLGSGIATLVINSKIKDREESKDEQGAQDLQTPGKILFGVTMAGLAATTVLVFFTDFRRDSEQPNAASVKTVFPFLVNQGAGVSMGGKF